MSRVTDPEHDSDEAFKRRYKGYYVLDIDARAAVAGPFFDWRAAVRASSRLNERRPHATPLEVRLVGPPAPAPYDQDPDASDENR